ncbi:hypothetical protein ABPG75_010301 [Micractinium tetrahymenae]
MEQALACGEHRRRVGCAALRRVQQPPCGVQQGGSWVQPPAPHRHLANSLQMGAEQAAGHSVAQLQAMPCTACSSMLLLGATSLMPRPSRLSAVCAPISRAAGPAAPGTVLPLSQGSPALPRVLTPPSAPFPVLALRRGVRQRGSGAGPRCLTAGMSACRTLAALACLAVLCSTAAAAAAGCTTERLPNAMPASDAPFTLEYQRSATVDQTTFYFKICAKRDAPPLSGFRLRLSNTVLAAPAKDIKLANPAGTVTSACPIGPGWWVRGPELGVLSEAPKANDCELFDVSVYNSGQPMPLSAICQQDVIVLGAGGKPVLNQATKGPSCLYSFEMANGMVAVGALVDNEHDAVPPSPRPPAPRPSPSGGYGYYHGSSAHARRLQQAPFVRSLLASAYYYGGHRRSLMAAAGADEPLAFATRRLMEASAVPLPRHLASLPGRQLASYGYYGSEHHRRSLQSVGALFGSGRTLTSYYYGSEHHRRSLMSVGQDSTFGRQRSSYYYGSPGRRLASIDRQLTSYGYYGSSHHRRLMAVGQESSFGRTLTSYYYGSHRRSLMSVGQEGTFGRQLSSYYGYGSHRRSLSSVGTIGRSLTSYGYYGSHRRSLSGVGTFGRTLSSYYGYQAHR